MLNITVVGIPEVTQNHEFVPLPETDPKTMISLLELMTAIGLLIILESVFADETAVHELLAKL